MINKIRILDDPGKCERSRSLLTELALSVKSDLQSVCNCAVVWVRFSGTLYRLTINIINIIMGPKINIVTISSGNNYQGDKFQSHIFDLILSSHTNGKQ